MNAKKPDLPKITGQAQPERNLPKAVLHNAALTLSFGWKVEFCWTGFELDPIVGLPHHKRIFSSLCHCCNSMTSHPLCPPLKLNLTQ